MVKKIFKVIRWVLALTFISTILAVVVYRFVPVYFTPLMLSRCFEQIGKGESVKLYHDWIPLEKMPKSMPVAVMASEDQRFLVHHGFDYQAIEAAAEDHLKNGKKLRGGSTISQQTAKNVFLWQGRSWLRKGLEAYFTFLIESLWRKPSSWTGATVPLLRPRCPIPGGSLQRIPDLICADVSDRLNTR